MSSDRRFAAIMFTDMVGYSALTQENESLSMELVKIQRVILRQCFSVHEGNEIKSTGDGFLVEFPTAIQAVDCAIEAQQSFHEYNGDASDERKIVIRIGVHEGEVDEHEGDIYGDGVNIAARIEPLAEPNGICISGSVAEQVEMRIDYPLVSMGEPLLKNIKATIEVFRVVTPWLADSIHFMPQKFQKETTTLKSIAVLPFLNVSSDQENEYFSDGLTEELINVLSRLPNLRVTSRTSAFVFKGKSVPLQQIGKQLNVGIVLEGSVRRSGNQVRITGQLIRVADDTDLWSGKFDRELDDIFAVQDEIAQAIVNTLEDHLGSGLEIVKVKRPTDNMDAYTLYLQGRFHFNNSTSNDVYKSIELYEQAIAEDRNYALAYVGLALSYEVLGVRRQLSGKEAYGKMMVTVQRAIELDNGLAEAHALLGMAYSILDRDFRKAEREFKIALALNPFDVMVYNSYGVLLLSMREYDKAIAMHSIANEMDPLHINTLNMLAQAHIFSCDYDQGIEILKKILSKHPDFPRIHLFLTIGYLLKGAYEEAVLMLEKTRHLTAEHPLIAVFVAIAQHRMGESCGLKQTLSELLAEQDRTIARPGVIAMIYAELDDEAQSVVWLQQAYEEYDSVLGGLKSWPRDQPIFQYPRTAKFIDEFGFPPV
jgi:TolB-like protein/class 3 adenylate cyclase